MAANDVGYFCVVPREKPQTRYDFRGRTCHGEFHNSTTNLATDIKRRFPIFPL